MQVWTSKFSELQLPVQNPAQEGTDERTEPFIELLGRS